MKNIYITAAEPYTGKSIIALGMMQSILQQASKVAFFRPILQTKAANLLDTDISLMLSYFGLHMNYEAAYGVSSARAGELLNSGRHDTLIEEILSKYKQLESNHDFVLCEGTDFLRRDAAFEFDLNINIATNLGGAVLTVISGHNRSSKEIIEFSQLILNTLAEKDLDNYALVINRCNLGGSERKALPHAIKQAIAANHTSDLALKKESPIFVVPENLVLAKPTITDVQEHVNAIVVSGHSQTDSRVEDICIAAGGTESFIKNLKRGALVLLPNDRPDIILSALASRLSSACPDIAGLLVCGNYKLSPLILNLLSGWGAIPLPILTTPKDLLTTARNLSSLHSKLSPKDGRKIAAALGVFEQHVKTSRLSKNIVRGENQKISPKMMELKLIDLARRKKMHIVLPEGTEERTLQATDILLARGAAQITLLGDEAEITSKARQLNLNIDAAKIINPALSPNLEAYSNLYFQMRQHKGMTEDRARETMLDSIYFGTMMLHNGDASGLVSGAIHTTANTIRPAFEIIKTKPGVKIASSVFLMCMHNKVFVFGDCAVNVDPTAEELADIALSSTITARLFGITPRVAMLSYSTGSSGTGAEVDKVAKATELVRAADPKLPLEGPIQYDAAVDPATARIKLPGSTVAGKASVFIFPDLNTGNNTYKAVQRAAGAVAIGPIIQGLNMPINDLSRGATVADIVNTIAITAIQAQSVK